MSAHKVPVEEIKFAAKAGFISYNIWNEFFADGAFSWRRRQWKDLVKRGYFFLHRSSRAKDVLILNPKNDVVKKNAGEIISPPFIAQIDHDETLYRTLLRLKRTQSISSFVTEGELKTHNFGLDRVRSAADRVKYPDAVIKLGGRPDGPTVAIELELTRKAFRRYSRIIGNYATRKYADSVIFIADSEGIFESLRKAMHENSYSNAHQPIGFVSFDEWIRDPLISQIHFGPKPTSLKEMLAKASDTHRSIVDGCKMETA